MNWIVANIGIGIAKTLGVLVGLVLLLFLAAFAQGTDLVVIHLIAGFGFFLWSNASVISTDAATWIPGLGAFLLALVIIHRFIKPWAVRTNRHWNFATSFCLVMILPVLFVIAFIIPGILLQWEMLRQVPWIGS